ncbi:DUF3187 family protein [Shewanella waksmanii]|uniref:DUF3187 family protein n=1 Tax=Shewanella waksmanii TaxID=213783 RepID=UPI003736620F
MKPKYLVIALPLYLSMQSHGLANSDPMQVGAQAPMQASSLTPNLQNAFSQPLGQSKVNMGFTAGSVWAHTEDYTADYYYNTVNVNYQKQQSQRFSWQANWQYQYSGNNHLDTLTIWFHDAFGFDQNGRDQTAKHQNRIIAAQHGVDLVGFDGATLNNALTLSGQYQLWQTAHHAVAVQASLYYNYVPSGDFKKGNFEQAVQVNYSYQYQQHSINTMVGVSYRDDSEVFAGLNYSHTAYAFAVGYNYALSEHHSLAIEYKFFSGASDGDTDLAENANEVVIGYRYQNKRWQFELVSIENIRNMDNSTDIAFALNASYLF